MANGKKLSTGNSDEGSNKPVAKRSKKQVKRRKSLGDYVTEFELYTLEELKAMYQNDWPEVAKQAWVIALEFHAEPLERRHKKYLLKGSESPIGSMIKTSFLLWFSQT